MASLWGTPDLPARSKRQLEGSSPSHLYSGVCPPSTCQATLDPRLLGKAGLQVLQLGLLRVRM